MRFDADLAALPRRRGKPLSPRGSNSDDGTAAKGIVGRRRGVSTHGRGADSARPRLGERHNRHRAGHQGRSSRRRDSRRRPSDQTRADAALSAAPQAARVCHHAQRSTEAQDGDGLAGRRPRVRLPGGPPGLRLGRPAAGDQRRRPGGGADPPEPRSRTRVSCPGGRRTGRAGARAADARGRARRTPHGAGRRASCAGRSRRRRAVGGAAAHPPRGPQPAGAADVRGGGAPGAAAHARAHRAVAGRPPSPRPGARFDARRGAGPQEGGDAGSPLRHGDSCRIQWATCDVC